MNRIEGTILACEYTINSGKVFEQTADAFVLEQKEYPTMEAVVGGELTNAQEIMKSDDRTVVFMGQEWEAVSCVVDVMELGEGGDPKWPNRPVKLITHLTLRTNMKWDSPMPWDDRESLN